MKEVTENQNWYFHSHQSSLTNTNRQTTRLPKEKLSVLSDFFVTLIFNIPNFFAIFATENNRIVG